MARYEKGSLMDLAVTGFQNIKMLAESSLISEKLVGVSALLFVLNLCVIITSWLQPSSTVTGFGLLVNFLVSLLFAFIISLVYTPVLSTIASFAKDKVGALRIGLIPLFVALPVAVGGLLYTSSLIKIAAGLIVLQLLLVLIGAVIDFVPSKTQDKVVPAKDVWLVIGRVADVLGIISFITTLVLILIK